ncbi:MAG: 50S ribosomal protein L10 [Candidatus Aenigmarchaeota archaeon]|nr:50S ribosomal protein L10 [Candidatus Aenigmarchaeota archaeon]
MLKKDKPKEVEKLSKLIDEYPVIGIVDIHKLPSRQMQSIKQKLRDRVKVIVSRKNIIIRALDNSKKKELKRLKDKITREPALILTDINPFRLYKVLNENKSPAPAREGDTAPKDIVAKAGPTELMPGPAITALQKLKIKTKVEAGKISILSDSLICKKGQKITKEIVDVLGMLKIEPMEIGLNLSGAWENGIIYDKDTLAIDEEEYKNKICSSVKEMINLSVCIGYPTKETIEIMIQKAYNEMKNLGIEANVIEKDIIEDLLAKAECNAVGLESIAKIS